MSYNLKNKSIAAIVVAFAALLSANQSCYAQAAPAEAEAEAAAPQTSDANAETDLFGLDETPAEVKNENTENNAADLQTEQNSETTTETAPTAEVNPEVSTENNTAADAPTADTPAADAPAADAQPQTTEENTQQNNEEDVVAEAPKSPFESFGNTILSKVDNSLFNQMADIEKQTTLLNLEYKREEVKNRIEALRAQRLKAQEELANNKKLEEARLKDEEMQRKLKEIDANEKLKEAEIKLEQTRQAKVLNDYMNEMLVTNQKWVEKNTSLQAQVAEMREERKNLINDFENKIAALRRESASILQKAENAKSAFDRMSASYKSQINSLKKSLIENEDTIKNLRSGNSANPFADLSAAGIDENAIDMSDEYAIMDITGKGKEIVAKIVSKDGTTFIIHQGSMLKGGEVVTAITDNYVAFDNKGVKSYLYTGGTVREYEPESSFNGADKTPVASKGIVNNNNSVVRNVRGAPVPATTSGAAPAATDTTVAKAPAAAPKAKTSKSSSSNDFNGGIPSLGEGMFVK